MELKSGLRKAGEHSNQKDAKSVIGEEQELAHNSGMDREHFRT